MQLNGQLAEKLSNNSSLNGWTTPESRVVESLNFYAGVFFVTLKAVT